MYSTLFVLVVASLTQAFFFKANVDKSEIHLGKSTPFIGKDFPRILSNHSCVCGEDFPGISYTTPKTTGSGHPTSYTFQKWILYIHLHLPNHKSELCVGTIINSNMVVTSHRCLQKKKRISVNDIHSFRANPYDPESPLASVKDITLATEFLLTLGYNVNLTVKKIIYSERFAYDSLFESAPDSDIAILVVDYDFTKPNNSVSRYPICVPSYGQLPTKRLLNKKAHYQGIYGWNGTNLKYTMGIHNFSYIRTAEDCIAEGMLGVKPTNNETLCLPFTQPGPTVPGGPLRINVKRLIEGGPYRSFLVGLATWVDTTHMNAGHKYALFSNINSVVKYIEHQATRQQSQWCSTPHPDDTIWPWERFQGGEDRSLDCECGRQHGKENSGRIIGGEEAAKLEFPWIAKLIITTNASTNATSLCGGSLINDRMILTAAHCFVRLDKFLETDSFNLHYVPNDPSIHDIYLQSHFLDNKKDQADTEHKLGYKVFAKQIVFHPGYPDEAREVRFDFDIALIILNQSLTLGNATADYKRMDPICLPEKGYVQKIIGENVTVAGWGLTIPDLGQFVSAELKKLNVPVRPMNECQAVDWQLRKIWQYPTDTRFCASYLTPWENAGAGDSGGPLMHTNKHGRLTQVGIVSYYNKDDAYTISTTYYTSVEAFLPYIYYYSKENGAKFCKRKK